MNRKAALLILDGWGHGQNPKVSAIDQANIPYVDHLYNTYPQGELTTFGEEVGLPHGQMGNSEVGHLNIGAGRIVYQELARINNEIKNHTLGQAPALQAAQSYAQEHSCSIHILGLLSDGGVHSHIDHIAALADLFRTAPNPVYIHAFTDGRDTAPEGGADYLRHLEDHIAGTNARVATVVGRYYAMDRDQRWERIKLAYDLLVHNTGTAEDDLAAALSQRYQSGETDEFIQPMVQAALKGKAKIENGDLVIFANFRTDRPRQLTHALTQEAHPEHDMQPLDLYFLTMTQYDEEYQGLHTIFTKDKIVNPIGAVISAHGLTQVRAAETEKYPHVTFFLNGGQEEPFPGEDRVLMPSPKVATYDLMPQMSAIPLTKAVIKKVKEDQPDFICLNYANTDMVGHTGSLRAAVLAAQTVDRCLAKLIPILQAHDYHIIIIADHGNADIMRKPDGSPHTAHTTNPVPIIAIGEGIEKVKNGKLADVAPTLLHLMNVDIPSEMTGDILI